MGQSRSFSVENEVIDHPPFQAVRPQLLRKSPNYWLPLAIACFFLFFFALGSWGFIDPGDGYFSEAAREMMERGEYLVPHLNYQIYFSKPILIYWMIISAYQAFGVNEFAARFWSAAMATALVAMTYWTTSSLANKRAGLLAALALATSPLYITFARMSLIDMTFSALVGMAFCSTAMVFFSKSQRYWPYIYVALGLAVLAKGPAALLVFFAGTFGFLLLNIKSPALRPAMAKLHLVKGLLIFSVITIPWYAAVTYATNGLWTKVFFLFENIARFKGHTNHKAPQFWFYLPVLAYGFFPWVLFLPAAISAPFREWFKNRGTPASKSFDPNQLALYFACSSLAILLFFSISLTKLQTYILPAFCGLSVMVGLMMDKWLTREELGSKVRYLRHSMNVLLGVAVVALIALCITTPVFINPDLLDLVHFKFAPAIKTFLAEQINPFWRVVSAIGLLIGPCGFIWARKLLLSGKTQRAAIVLMSTVVVTASVAAQAAFHIGYNVRQHGIHEAIRAIPDDNGKVVIFRDFKPSIIFHLKRPVDTFFDVTRLFPLSTKSDTKLYMIVGSNELNEMLAAHGPNIQMLSHKGNWYVFTSNTLGHKSLPTLEESFKSGIDLSGGEFSWGTLPFAGGTKPPSVH